MNDSYRIFLENYFLKLGFNTEETSICLCLIEKGELTILEVSKLSGVERTKVYRIVDQLLLRGIIEERIEYNKKFLKIADISRIEQLVEEIKGITSYLEISLPGLSKIFNEIKDSNTPTKVKFFRGVEGLKQVLWNELDADKEILAYAYRNLQEIGGSKFFAKWSREFERRNLIVKDLRSKEFMLSDKNITLMPLKGDYIRYIEPEILDIITEIDIYNNIVVVINWHQGDIFAVEIENEKLAKMQKQIFEVFWKMAKPFTKDEWDEFRKK